MKGMLLFLLFSSNARTQVIDLGLIDGSSHLLGERVVQLPTTVERENSLIKLYNQKNEETILSFNPSSTNQVEQEQIETQWSKLLEDVL